MVLLLQRIWAVLETWLCRHKWYRLTHHGLPGEPFLMRCDKCLKITGLDPYLTDKLSNQSTTKE